MSTQPELLAEAIRKYCNAQSPAAVQTSLSVERIYYAGLALDGLVSAVLEALPVE
jgi:hypothetical protein